MRRVLENQLPLGRGVSILSEDASGLVALFKPAGIMSHPNEPKDASRSLLTARYNLEEECYELGEVEGEGESQARIWLLNRLDSATSGVILCAVQVKVAEVVRRCFAQGQVEKKYFALVFGTLSPPKQVWKDRLQVSREEGRLRTSTGGGAEAETEVRVERAFPGRYPIALIELRPKTGRTHQLRVQCGKRKMPIVGDQTYGNFAWNREFSRATGRKRLFLHAEEVKLSFKLEGRQVRFSARAPLPSEFTP